jgi:putative transposase
MIAFIDDHRAVYGVEPICRVVPTIPSMLWNKRCLIDERLGKL